MMAYPILHRCLLIMLSYLAWCPLYAQQAGDVVRIQGDITEDVYAAGGTVDVTATVAGDVVVAGGRVSIDKHIAGDVIAAGGTLNLQAVIEDDVRIAGGDVQLSSAVGDDAIVAGGNLTLTPDTEVKGRAWLTGGNLNIAGEIGKELKAAGGRIVLSGQVNGDVELRGDDISILDSTVIDGDLVYHSPQQANIASGAQIRGSIHHEPVERPIGAFIAAFVGVGLLVLLSLLVTGILLYLVFPRFLDTSMVTIRTEPWKCLGLGLAVFAATPMVISLLLFTVIGWLPAIIIGALYMLLLLGGFLAGIYFAGDLGWNKRGTGEMSKSGRLWSFVIALIGITLLGLIPLLGTLLLFVIMLLGVGVLQLGLYRSYVGQGGD